ncbi:MULTISPECIES: sensor histidine kinase [Brevibacillus]|uniref:histidine kinase n=1 Tax=Brevibacillus parabrevis TaxID=54914 RepID=A0A4Y3PIQ1_BREPA|nr:MULTISPECIES: sensor histidine kinase [Brevibacillus]MDH6351968.1 OmpR family two-component system sensor histidine kinase YxdK [Brevibacillus sp. 1238]MED2257032.1 sensor histidine kinase [Brevibacillus parabrevis]NRQ56204.1 sensor histidine kinase [Brevibacillus sp. HD1.4A]RNB93864.1 sensor histidine kinase [Brevibacillus parabrevis]UED69697.1 sensor histidine kinase [Brevibacillus sp. HD3.3A]
MKLFLRDQWAFAAFFLVQLFLLILIFAMDGYWNESLVIYVMFLSVFFAGAFLVVRYLTHRLIYQRLSKPVETLEELTQTYGNAALCRALDEKSLEQYRLYKEQLHAYENKQRDYTTFIQQWVHQMKTPISVIHLLLQNEDDPKSESVREEIDRIKRGLETVLYIARLDRFEQDFLIEPVAIRTLTQNVLAENKRLFIRNQVYPELKIEENWRVESDDKWLSFVLNQLLTNAVRYSAGKSNKVTIRAYERGQHVVLEVQDYGIGIPAEDIRRVFKPYFTGENGRKYPESTGMGLYLVKEICGRLHHGVEMDSEVGEGTTVRLVLSAVVPTLQERKDDES